MAPAAAVPFFLSPWRGGHRLPAASGVSAGSTTRAAWRSFPCVLSDPENSFCLLFREDGRGNVSGREHHVLFVSGQETRSRQTFLALFSMGSVGHLDSCAVRSLGEPVDSWRSYTKTLDIAFSSVRSGAASAAPASPFPLSLSISATVSNASTVVHTNRQHRMHLRITGAFRVERRFFFQTIRVSGQPLIFERATSSKHSAFGF